jgi:hypothetical protein
MKSYQYVILYFSIKANAYFKIASAWLPTNDGAALDTITGIFCGITAIPDMRIAFVGNGKRKFRHMQNGDVVEVAGKAHVYIDGSFYALGDIQPDHQYSVAIQEKEAQWTDEVRALVGPEEII